MQCNRIFYIINHNVSPAEVYCKFLFVLGGDGRTPKN